MAGGGFKWIILVCTVGGCMAGEAIGAPPVAPPGFRAGTTPPLPLDVKPPAELFRQLLAATPAEREALLADRPPQRRQVITNALREYESLSPGVREIRLHTLELGWYLDPLLRMVRSNRTDRLAAVPQPFRQELEDRLRIWDPLPQELQRQILENRIALRVMLSTTATVRSVPPEAGKRPPLPPPLETQQRQLHACLKLLFDLDGREKVRVMESLSFSKLQRAQVTKALLPFESLPKTERDLCLEGLAKFGNLTSAQRDEFLRKCQSWKSMSATEQEAWRRLVAIRMHGPPPVPGVSSTPPLPPGAGEAQLPPMPRPATN